MRYRLPEFLTVILLFSSNHDGQKICHIQTILNTIDIYTIKKCQKWRFFNINPIQLNKKIIFVSLADEHQRFFQEGNHCEGPHHATPQ